ncbi:methanogenesis marker 8 protein [uncultured Methanospirillum sp.]|uniref:methanogenesis marker 8 protein n=1 Tax=uncultured Methanospirillum sp. TaxID=262503 RepID=UPI0029C88E19|nr:methanogenesis marker 8 protein [uncultured Methanospirillum sp.]
MTDEHIIEAIGRSRVVVRDGKVVEVGEAVIKDCPLAKRFACPVEEFTPAAVKKNIENRIASFGMCTPDRSLTSDDDFVGFGASELTRTGLARGIIDAAVLACDGAGTVVVTDPAMAQGIGGRMSGLVSTSPIRSVIERIEAGGGIVPDPVHASMDPLTGVAAAHKAGHSRLLVTVPGADAAEAVRRADPDALIMAVHVTGTSQEDAIRIAAVADITTGCASRYIREVCGKKALMQAGTAVPIFILTQRGKELLLARLAVIPNQILVSHTALPVSGGKTPDPLV